MSFQVSRRKRSVINVGLALVSQVSVVIAGLFLPIAIIRTYGSEANGLVTSLQQIIAYFTLVEGGLAGAAVYALYKPLAQDNLEEVCQILSATKKFYYKAAAAYLLLLLAAMSMYPYLIAKTTFSAIEIMALVLIIGVNGAVQLLAGKYKALLIASQYSGIASALNGATTVLYCIIIIALSYFRFYILIAFAAAAFAYLIRGIAFYIAVRKIHPQVRYNIDSKGYQLPQRKDVLLQQILSMLIMNSSIIILTFTRTSMVTISIFTVYNLVLSSLYLIMDSINSGITAGFGDLIARGDKERIQKNYKEFEVLFQMIWTCVFSCLSSLYLPFVRVYTLNVTDAQYVQPSVCFLFILIGAFWTIRNQQSIFIVAAGKYREIRTGSIIEALLTVILSALGFITYGLNGLLIGRLAASAYRAVDFIVICSKNIVKVPLHFTIRQITLSIITISVTSLTMSAVFPSYPDSFAAWMLEAFCCFIVSVVFILLFRIVLDRTMTFTTIKHFSQIIKNTILRRWKANV